nr:reverse transcriptase domain-containing protein [Tanacetum cinerariifolium]
MSTHSSTRNLFPPLDNPELRIRRRSRVDPPLLNDFEMATEGNGDPPVADLRTMEELCQPSLNGRGGPIAPIAIQATNFRLKNDMIQQVQNSCQLYGLSSDDANKHLDKFLHVTQIIKVNGVTDDALRLNEITNFRQRPDESLFEAWERYKLSIDPLKAKMAEINKNLMNVLQINQQVKAVTPSCETYGVPHSYNDCPATVGQTQNVYAAGAYQGGIKETIMVFLRETTKEETNSSKELVMTNITSLINSNLELKNMFGQFMKMNTASSSSSETLRSNTITNLKEDLKGITTRSRTAYQGPIIPTTSFSPPKVVERKTEPVVTPVAEPVVAPVSALKPNQKSSIPYPYSANYNDMTANRIDVIDIACEEYSQEVLGFFDMIASGNPTPYYDIIVSTSSPTLTPFGDSDFLLEEVDAFFALEDDPTSPEVDHSYYNTKGDILLLEAFRNDDPSLPPPTQGMYLPQVRKELRIFKAKNDKSSIDEPPEVKLKDLPPHLEYAFLEGDDKLPVIIAKDFSFKEKAALIKVLKSHKQATAWKLSDIMGINPEFCTHKILMEDDFKPGAQHQRREVDAFFALEDDPTSPEVDHSYYNTKGDILLLEAFRNDDPSLPPPTQGMYLPQVRKELRIFKAKNDKSSIDEPPEVKLKDLPPHLEYAFLEGDDKLPVIIAKDFSFKEKAALIKVLKSHKQATAWKLFDIKGINPEFCTHKILMEDDFKPGAQHQRRVQSKTL